MPSGAVCGNCGESLTGEGPCPKCGSSVRSAVVKASESVGAVGSAIVDVSHIVSQVSGIAANVEQQARSFLQSNPYLDPSAQAIILKLEEDFANVGRQMNEINSKIASVNTEVESANTQIKSAGQLRHRAVDWIAGAVVGVVITLVVTFLLHLL